MRAKYVFFVLNFVQSQIKYYSYFPNKAKRKEEEDTNIVRNLLLI